MLRTDQMENFAICCTANLPIEALNRFLAQVQQQEHAEEAGPILTVVDNLETRLWGPTKELRGDDQVLQSPFVDLEFTRIQQQLRQTVQLTKSPLSTAWFLVLDETSEQTSTAVIVNVGDEGVRVVRVAYPVASRYISAASVSHPPIDELIEIADEEGNGVLQD
ncbi:hypothetical protein D6D13_10640 [Aureobasidium pullulans]|uniref:Uncharacterized protein n=1 Tax=Aureobasidium pullulans TaxID=5580 RepID=A0A4S9BY09_AURPU|nr:hypothetical protein D6D13_10640 [Aureobasidium pullulans]